MPVATKNTELVPKRELTTLIQYNEELLKSKDRLGGIIPVLHNAAFELETYTGDYKTLVQTIQLYEKLRADAKKAVNDYGHSINALAAAEKRYAQSLSDEGKQLAIVKEKTRQQNQENRTMAKEVLAADNSLNKLRATQARMIAEANNMDILSEEYAKAQVEIKKLNDAILAEEATRGDHRRNVGHYASAFNNLGFQVQQVARELPSLTVSTGQFFLAISNNLPMLADAYKDTIDKNKAIREANKGLAADMQQKVVPAWAQMLKSVISWQTALVVAVTLVTAYSKEIGQFFSELFKGKQTVSDTAKAIEDMNKAMDVEDVGKKVADFKRLAALYKELGDNAQAKEEFIRKYKDEIDGLGIAVNNVIDAGNLFISGEAAFIESVKKRAKALGGLKLASEKYGEASALEVEYASEIAALEAKRAEYEAMAPGEKKSIMSGFEVINYSREELILSVDIAIQKYRNEILKLEQEAGALIEVSNQAFQDADDLLNKNGLKKLDSDSQSTTTRLSEKRQAEIELEKAQAEESAAIQQSIYEDESRNYAERAIALSNFYARKRELAQIDYDAAKEELDARLSAGEIDQATYDARLAAFDFAKNAAFRQLKRDQQNAGMELAQAIADGMVERMGTAAENVVKELNASMQSELLALANEYKQGLIDKEEFEKKKAVIADKYRRQQFEKEISMLEAELKFFTHTEEDREKLQKELTEKQIEYNQYKNDQQIASDTEAGDAAAEIEKSKASLKMQLLDEVFNFASTLNNAWLEKEIDRLDKESEANEEWRDDEIERIEKLEEQGVISKEQAEARKQQIEDQAAANEEEIEKKRIEAQRQAAIYDKAISAAQAGIAIALAITKSLATPALIPWIAALGAVQLATILATPIPEYAQGTDDHGGGLAIVGDGGRPELVVLPDRTMWRTPATDTLVNLPEHSQVLPDYYAAVRELAMPRLEDADMPIVDMSGVTRRQDQAVDKITETNRLIRVSIARADKRSKTDNAFLLNTKPSKIWNS